MYTQSKGISIWFTWASFVHTQQRNIYLSYMSIICTHTTKEYISELHEHQLYTHSKGISIWVIWASFAHTQKRNIYLSYMSIILNICTHAAKEYLSVLHKNHLYTQSKGISIWFTWASFVHIHQMSIYLSYTSIICTHTAEEYLWFTRASFVHTQQRNIYLSYMSIICTHTEKEYLSELHQ